MLLQGGAVEARAQAATQLTPVDTLLVQVVDAGGVDWSFWVNVFSSLAAAASVFFAWRATKAAVDAIRDSRATRIEDRETAELARDEAYYKALVADPALASAMPFVSQAARLIENAMAEVGALGREVSILRIDQITDRTIEEFKGLYLELRLILITGATAWADPKLTKQLNSALHELEDSTISALAGLSSKQPEDVRALLQRHGSKILSIVRAGHPSIIARHSKPITTLTENASVQAVVETVMT